jgi:hypothetical protein
MRLDVDRREPGQRADVANPVLCVSYAELTRGREFEPTSSRDCRCTAE